MTASPGESPLGSDLLSHPWCWSQSACTWAEHTDWILQDQVQIHRGRCVSSGKRHALSELGSRCWRGVQSTLQAVLGVRGDGGRFTQSGSICPWAGPMAPRSPPLPNPHGQVRTLRVGLGHLGTVPGAWHVGVRQMLWSRERESHETAPGTSGSWGSGRSYGRALSRRVPTHSSCSDRQTGQRVPA